MTRGSTAIALVLVVCYPIAALVAAPEQPSATAAEVRELLQAKGAGDLGDQLGRVAARQLSVALRRTYPGLPERADTVVMDVVLSYLRQQAEHDHVTDRLIPIYGKYLTEDDVRRITEFYRSPAGRKLVSVTPAISLESAKVGQEWMESIQPGLQAELVGRLKSEKLIE